MRARRLLIIIAVAVCCQLSVGAASAADYARFGPYFGVNGAYGVDLFKGTFGLVPVSNALVSVGGTGGLNTRLGLRFFKFVAVEAQYEWFDGFDIAVAGVDVTRLGNHTLTGNLKLFLPIWRIQPYIMGGIGVTWWNLDGIGAFSGLPKQSGNGFAGRAGLGLELYLTENILINGEASAVLTSRELNFGQFIGTPVSIDQFYYMSLSAGLTYRF